MIGSDGRHFERLGEIMENELATKHDVAEGGVIGAVGGAIVGEFAGGPVGAIIGAVVGGAASAGATHVVDQHDGDNRGVAYHNRADGEVSSTVFDVDSYAKYLQSITPLAPAVSVATGAVVARNDTSYAMATATRDTIR